MVLPLWLLVNVLTVFAVAYTLTPRLVNYFGNVWGNQIRRRTQQRRELLIARARTENAESRGERTRTVDDEWEKIDRSRSRSGSEDEESNHDQWEGVIGFFHPFW